SMPARADRLASGSVLVILRSCRRPQIPPPIIRPVSVFMIYVVGWPLARHQKPREAMRVITLAINRYAHIAIALHRAGHFSEEPLTTPPSHVRRKSGPIKMPPPNMTVRRVIFEKIAENQV